MESSDNVIDGLGDLNVTNVYIYVSDALRWDHLSDRIGNHGTVIKSVAASTHSPSSFASILTGLYPPNHGVQSFRNQLQSSISTLLDISNHNTRFLNSIFEYAERDHSSMKDPIYSVLNTDQPQHADPFKNLEQPFCVIERGPGGHAPYGEFDGTADDYFRQNGTSKIEKIREDYSRSVDLDTQLFLDRFDKLRNKKLADDTVVIFTSDHGELLGEGGELGHTSPMRPELVYIPTVFIHPDLPSTEINDAIFHHVDIFPTVIDMFDIDENIFSPIDGFSAIDHITNDPRPCFYNNTLFPEWVPLLSGRLRYEGVWDANGGYVNVESSLSERLAVLGGKISTSSRRRFILRELKTALRAYSDGSTITYGSPSFPASNIKSILTNVTNTQIEQREIELSESAEQKLRDLGYK